MPSLKPSQPAAPHVIPGGELRHLSADEIKPSSSNPRRLFDEEELRELKRNIGEHGVLVPITVYRARGQTKFSILDGERRYRCVVDLRADGRSAAGGGELTLPANVVEPPTKVAGLLYMFSIHNLREAWELMPTALGLRIVMEELDERDSRALSKLTGLSEAQIERCKKLLRVHEDFQKMSLDPDPKARIPSNFWIEADPVVSLGTTEIPAIAALGSYKATQKLVDKYRAGKVKSVIHFRKVMEAYDLSEGDPAQRAGVLRVLQRYFLDPNLETRAAFDEFVVDKKRVASAVRACEDFIELLKKFKLRYASDAGERGALRAALGRVRDYCKSLEQELSGSDDPDLHRG